MKKFRSTIKWFLSGKQRALNRLDLTPEEAALAAEMKDGNNRRAWALKFLGINKLDLRIVNKIKTVGPKAYALEILGLGLEEYHEYINHFKGKKKWDKLQFIIGSGKHHIRDFFNLCYSRFLSYREKNKSNWKKEGTNTHLLVIQNIINKAIVTDTLSTDDLQEIAMRAFMAYDCLRGKKVVTPTQELAAA